MADQVAQEVMENNKSDIKKSNKDTVLYSHTLPVHTTRLPSPLSKEAPPESYRGFINLAVLVLFAIILRLLIENYRKYGLLIKIPRMFETAQVKLVLQTWCLIPINLIISYLIELWAAQTIVNSKLKSRFTISLLNIRCSLLHTSNILMTITIPAYVAWVPLQHPILTASVLFPSVILFLKLISYALFNADLRQGNQNPPSEYNTLPYPSNITLGNLVYFWLAPTLCYQPSYPHSLRFRKSFFVKRIAEIIFLSIAMMFLIEQYATPTLKNSIQAIDDLDFIQIAERVLKLSTVSLAIWLIGFYALFHSFLNALAEITMFGDRTFYLAWWNSGSLATYWRLWNRPVYQWCKRHVFLPAVAKGISPMHASLLVFFISAVLHEVLVAIPAHSLLGVAFMGMMLQIPLIIITRPLEKMRGQGTMIGNCIFWVTFTILGQPTCALLYFHSATKKMV